MLTLNNRYDFIIEEYLDEKHNLLEALHLFFDNPSLDLLWQTARDVRQSYASTQLPQLDYVRGYMTHDNILKQLDVKYWRKLMDETKFLNYVSSKERQKWHEQFDKREVPEFTIEAIKPTLSDLMRSLPDLFAQRLRDAHDALSTAHKTNKAQKLDKRMIFTVMYPDKWSWEGGSYSDHAVGAINDIRSTISQILGGEQLNHYDTKSLLTNISKCKNFGEWVKIDSYVAVRIYKKGTCHMEIHPILLDKLNSILANGTLPDMSQEWYTKEEKKRKTEFHDLVFTSISQDLRNAIESNKPNGHPFWDYIDYGTYDATPVLKYVTNTGLLPEFKSHQYYPTPRHIVEDMHKYIPSAGTILEPSAGTGRLIAGLQDRHVTCIDISELHCEILKAKGFTNTHTMDFMKYSTDNKFDIILMNPPYSKQRALLHMDKAKKHLSDNGIILAVIPTGKITDDMEVLHNYKGGFDNTNINTSLVLIRS